MSSASPLFAHTVFFYLQIRCSARVTFTDLSAYFCVPAMEAYCCRHRVRRQQQSDIWCKQSKDARSCSLAPCHISTITRPQLANLGKERSVSPSANAKFQACMFIALEDDCGSESRNISAVYLILALHSRTI